MFAYGRSHRFVLAETAVPPPPPASPDHTADPPPRVERQPRILASGVRRDVVVIGRDTQGLGDLYHDLLTLSWLRFLGLAFLIYLAINLAFGLAYFVDPKGVSHTGAWSFGDAFFLSVQTFGTIGYGALAPQDLYANLVVTVESFVSLGSVAVLTGVIFARVSRPSARVMFSRNALVTTYDGRPTLLFRAANQRGNYIVEADVSMNLARQTLTQEGLSIRRMLDLKAVRSRSPLFALSWMGLHVIDEDSPLYGATAESLMAESAEIVVVISGVDESFASRIHARHSYLAEEILFDKQFADILSIDDDGRRVVDYSRFHDLRDMEP